MFSSRLRRTGRRNRLAGALERRRIAGLPVLDLTLSNPTCAGFTYPLDALQLPTEGQSYDPVPFGLVPARQAVADDFARRGIDLAADRVVLTASTSEAYSLLFKLLCDPGDAVLAPRPSYPLIEHLTELDGVAVEYYALDFHGHWAVDLLGIREKLRGPNGRRIKAVIAITPNNPTGSALKGDEIDALAALAHEHDLAFVSDEVFADYPLGGPPPPSALRQRRVLTFALGGLSKTIGLPQMKLGWIGVGGPEDTVDEALERLETICDAYLSVSTPVQIAAPRLLRAGASVRAQIQRRVSDNLAYLSETARAFPACSVLPVEAGWSAVVQVPALKSEEDIALDLLDRTGVLVHPGYFFDFEREAFLVVSLLPESEVFTSGVKAMLAEVGRTS